MNLLNPFQINNRHDPDEQIHITGNINLVSDYPAMQPFVEEEIGIGWHRLPRGEGAGLPAVAFRFFMVVQIACLLYTSRCV